MVRRGGVVLISTEQLHMPGGVLIKTHTEDELCRARTLQSQVMGRRLKQAHKAKSGSGAECRSPPYSRMYTQGRRQLAGFRPGQRALSDHWPVKGTSHYLPRLIIAASRVRRIALVKISVPCHSVPVCVLLWSCNTNVRNHLNNFSQTSHSCEFPVINHIYDLSREKVVVILTVYQICIIYMTHISVIHQHCHL